MRHILSYLCSRPWAITETAMNDIQRTIEEHGKTDLEAVAAKLGRPLTNASKRAEQRGSVAVLTVEGPLFRYANIFTEISGATSVELLSTDLQAALEDSRVESILLNVNSPGGEADGVSELAGMIREASAKKPVWAYVGGFAASGGYWLASAAQRIVMHPSGYAGSIGVIATVTDDRGSREKSGVRRYEIVSSQSPNKRVDPSTDAGQAQLQEMVDEMAALFITQVAGFRNTTDAYVMERFGRGFVVSAQRAITAGMADEMGTYEGTLRALNGLGQQSVPVMAAGFIRAALAVSGEEDPSMAEERQPDMNDVRAQAVITERTRINAILGCEEATGREKLAKHLALDTAMSVEEAKGILAAAEPALTTQTQPVPSDAFAAHMRGLPNPRVGVSVEQGTDDVAEEVARISAFLPNAQRRTQ